MNRYFVAGVILGVLIAVIYRNITKSDPQPPRKSAAQPVAREQGLGDDEYLLLLQKDA